MQYNITDNSNAGFSETCSLTVELRNMAYFSTRSEPLSTACIFQPTLVSHLCCPRSHCHIPLSYISWHIHPLSSNSPSSSSSPSPENGKMYGKITLMVVLSRGPSCLCSINPWTNREKYPSFAYNLSDKMLCPNSSPHPQAHMSLCFGDISTSWKPFCSVGGTLIKQQLLNQVPIRGAARIPWEWGSSHSIGIVVCIMARLVFVGHSYGSITKVCT